MTNKKLEKFLVKGAISLAFTIMLGLVYSSGEKATESIDETYLKKHGVKKKKLLP